MCQTNVCRLTVTAMKPGSGWSRWRPWYGRLAASAASFYSNSWSNTQEHLASPRRCIRTRPIEIPFRLNARGLTRATWPSRNGLPQSFAGMHWPWWCAPIRPTANWAGISPVTPLPLKFSRWGSTIFSVPVMSSMAAIWCFSSRTRRLGSMPVRSLRGACLKNNWPTIARKSAATA